MTRQRTSRRLVLVVLLCVVMVMSLVLAACSGGRFVITWNIDEHATVTVEGAKKLPEKAKEGAVIEFTITTEAGYVVDEVLRDKQTINPNTSGKYSITISADVTISVTTKRAISGITVVEKPTKLTYQAGETLDKTGMVVQLEHTVGEPETITEYRIRYQGGAAASNFQLGDTYFTVYYDSHVSDPVELDATVAAHITIDSLGGAIGGEYVSYLESIEGLEGVQYANGIVTFSYTQALKDDIALPTSAQISKGEAGDYTFNAWQINGDGEWLYKLSKDTAVSTDLVANYTAHLAEIAGVDYEAVDGVPYLVIKGTYKAATTLFTYLTEGNRHISYSFENTVEGARGEEFELRANMLDLVAAKAQDNGSFVGPWLDLKIAHEANGVIETMEIPYDTSYERISVTDGDETYRFGFAVWGDMLKVAITVLAPYNYTMTVANTDDVLTLTFDGKIIPAALGLYAGHLVKMDWWMNATIGPVEATIAEDGSWKIEFVLSPETGFILDTLGYAHFAIVNAETGAELYKDGNDGNLLSNALANREDLTKHDIPHGDFGRDSLMISNSDGTLVYYVGIPNWDAIVVYGMNPKAPKISANGDIELKVDNFEAPTKVYYVVKLTVENMTEDEVFAIVLGNTDGSIDVFNSDRALSKVDGKVYTLWYDVTEYAGSQLWPNLYMPKVVGDATEYEKLSAEVGGDNDYSTNGLYAIVNGIKYSILCGEGTWSRPCLVTEPAAEGETNPPAVNPDAVKKEIVIDGASFELVVEDGKPYVIIMIKATGFKGIEEIKSSLMYGNTDGDFEWKTACFIVDTESDDSYRLWFDITGMQVGNDGKLWSNLYLDGQKVEIKDTTHASHGMSITVGGIVYTVECTGNNGTWDIPCITTKEAGNTGNDKDPDKDPDEGTKKITIDSSSFNLVELDGKPCVEIKFTASGFTGPDEIMSSIMYGNTDGSFDWKVACCQLTSVLDGYIIYFDITSIKVGNDGRLWSNLYLDGEKIEIKDTTHASHGISLTVGEVVYTVECTGDGGTWHIPCITIKQLGDPEYTATGATLTVEGDKLLYVITGTYSNYTQEAFEKLVINFDLQVNDNIFGGGWARNSKFEKNMTVNVADSMFTVTIDITSLIKENLAYTTHFDLGEQAKAEPADFKPDTDAFEMFVEFNGFKVKMSYIKGSGEGAEFWGCVGLTVTKIGEPYILLNSVLEIEVSNDKAYIVIKGQYDYYDTVDALKAALSLDTENASNWEKTTLTAWELTTDNGSFTIKVDLSSMANGQYLVHVNGKDVGHEGGIAAVTAGGRSYSYEFKDFGGWTRFVLTIA